MPYYMDIHELPGITPEQLAQAHAADLETQRKYGVKYQKYWVNHGCGKVFCLAEAPNAAAAEQVHREAHGFVAEKMIDSANKQAIIDTGIPPSSNLESAIVTTLPANGAGYTAIVRGVNNTAGIAVVEVYALQ